MDYEWIEKTILKKIRSNKKKKQNQGQNAGMWTEKTTSEKWKFNSNKKLGLKWAWMDWENHLEKNPIQKSKKH